MGIDKIGGVDSNVTYGRFLVLGLSFTCIIYRDAKSKFVSLSILPTFVELFNNCDEGIW